MMNYTQSIQTSKPCRFLITIDKPTYYQGYIRSDQGLNRVAAFNQQGQCIKTLLERGADRSVGVKETEVFWYIPQAGHYDIEITPDSDIDRNSPATITIQFTSFDLNTDQYLSPQAPIISPLLHQTAQEMCVHKAQAETQFWEYIAQRGTPLIESLAHDDSTLLTFLFNAARVDGNINNVRVMGAPYDGHVHLTQLNQSSIWYHSIRVPNQSRFSYRIAPNVPQLIERNSLEQRRAVLASTQADPLNHNPLFAEDDPLFGPASTVNLSQEACGYDRYNPDIPKGEITTWNHHSKRLHLDHSLPNTRTVSIYRPHPSYTTSSDSPLLILFDGDAYLTRVPTPTILDNLIAQGEIPPLHAVFINHPLPSMRGKELTPNREFADYIATELMPWLKREHHIAPPAARTIVSGSSFGGLASLYLAFTYPNYFGNVLSQSGSFWWAPHSDLTPSTHNDTHWFAEEVLSQPKKAVEIYMNAGLFEVKPETHNILKTNRQLYASLKTRGYTVHYQEFASGHDYFSWRATLALGLITLLGSSSDTETEDR